MPSTSDNVSSFGKTLVVIDMQPEFTAANEPRVISNVTREIIYSKQKDEPVLFVEYKNCWPTFSYLMDLLRGYSKRGRIKKEDDDGSAQIANYIKKRKIQSETLRVCGVNADCCIYSTVEGLLNKLPNTKIEVVKDACGWSESNPNPLWNRYIKHPNLRLV